MFRVPLSLSMLTLLFLLCYGCDNKKSTPIRVVTEINAGESRDIALSNGENVNLKVLKVTEIRDSLRNAIRNAIVSISVDGIDTILNTGNYNLPVRVGKVQIDCPVTRGHFKDPGELNGDVQLRLWPAGSAFFTPGEFVYPLKQRWFSCMTQTGNEPTYVDWGEQIANKNIYYHNGHDTGGAEGLDEVFCAVAGTVICANMDTLSGYTDFPGDNRTDVVYLVDDRGWYYRYSHLDSVDPAIKTGSKIKKGQKIGMMGKQGGSGGWVHLHFDISYKEESGKWRTEDAYPYVWEAYMNQYHPSVIAVARPHHLIWAGDEAELDGSKSVSFTGKIISYEWTFTDSSKALGPVVKRRYDKPGEYSEILKITDENGNVDYDFAIVQVYDRKEPEKKIPAMQAVFYPTLGIKAGHPVKFLVRTFNTDVGEEVWDFGDGSPKVSVRSEKVNRQDPRKGKFAETTHSFSKPGNYIVRVQRSNENGYTGINNLDVLVEK